MLYTQDGLSQQTEGGCSITQTGILYTSSHTLLRSWKYLFPHLHFYSKTKPLRASQVALVVRNPPVIQEKCCFIPGSGRSPGEGNGNPLQYSCLENPMDRGAWWATVHTVTKSQTRLKQLSMQNPYEYVSSVSWHSVRLCQPRGLERHWKKQHRNGLLFPVLGWSFPFLWHGSKPQGSSLSGQFLWHLREQLSEDHFILPRQYPLSSDLQPRLSQDVCISCVGSNGFRPLLLLWLCSLGCTVVASPVFPFLLILAIKHYYKSNFISNIPANGVTSFKCWRGKETQHWIMHVWMNWVGWKVRSGFSTGCYGCCCLLAKSCLTLWPHGLQPARLLCPWDFPGRNTGVGCHFLLWGIFPIQGLNPYLLSLMNWQVDPSPLSHLGSQTLWKRNLLTNPISYKMKEKYFSNKRKLSLLLADLHYKKD